MYRLLFAITVSINLLAQWENNKTGFIDNKFIFLGRNLS